MTDAEFQDFGTYLMKLWPKFTMNPEQRDLWRSKFGKVSIFDARQAAANAFAQSRFTMPKMGEITEALRKIRVADTVQTKRAYEFPPALVQQVADDMAADEAALDGWTDGDREDGRAEILRHEPCLVALIGKCKPRDPMLSHFLAERFVHRRAWVFPNGNPLEVSVDEYWRTT